jgi:hypothetical protein
VKRKDDLGADVASWMRAYGLGTAFLTERTLGRVARYQRSVTDLTRQQSVEPRLWIGALQSFWSGMADDYGDFLRAYVVDDPRPSPIEVNADESLRLMVRINEDKTTDQQKFDLPKNLFDAGFTKAKLTTDGLFLANRCVLRRDQHLLFEPPEITPADSTECTLRLMNLPNELTAGMTLVGAVFAERTGPKLDDGKRVRRLVAVIQARVI